MHKRGFDPLNALRKAVAHVTAGKVAKRPLIALAYKDGISMRTLNDRYAILRSTVYYWFDCFEEILVDEAIEDDSLKAIWGSLRKYLVLMTPHV